MFKYFLYKISLFILSRTSLQTSYKFATFISDMQYTFSVKDRKAVERNLKRIITDREIKKTEVRDVFRNFGRYLVEFFKRDALIGDDFFTKHVRLENDHYLSDALKKGKGAIIVTAHIGNWEMGGVIMSMIGLPVSVVALPHKEKRVNDLFNHQRESKGVQVIPTSTAVRRVIEHLKDNRLVAIVADRDFGESGFTMDFLGYPTQIPKGAALFSWKTGVPIIPVFCLRDGDERFLLKCLAPIDPPEKSGQTKAGEETLRRMIQLYLTSIEDQIKAHPSQWLLFRDFNLQ